MNNRSAFMFSLFLLPSAGVTRASRKHGIQERQRFGGRALMFVGAFCLAWCAAAVPARACSFFSRLTGVSPSSTTALPSGEVFIVIQYDGRVAWSLDDYAVTNELGDEVPVTVSDGGSAVVLRFDTTGAEEVSVFGVGGSGIPASVLASYEVSLDAPDPRVPSSPRVTIGETTCSACSEPLNSCCARNHTEGRLSTSVSFERTEDDTVLVWLTGSGQVAGVVSPGTYASTPAHYSPLSIPPLGTPIVAMTVAGVVSVPATWAVPETGPCDVESPSGPGEGCSVASGRGGPSATGLFALGLALWSVRRRRARLCARTLEL